MQRISRAFAHVMISTSLGILAGTFVPLLVLVPSLLVLTGGRWVLLRRRQRSRFARLVLNLGSSEMRRAA